MINTDFIKGIIVPILTPIDENENIDERKLRFMVDHVIEGGVHGILAYGSNVEFYGVEEKEMERGPSHHCRSGSKTGSGLYGNWQYYNKTGYPSC